MAKERNGMLGLKKGLKVGCVGWGVECDGCECNPEDRTLWQR